MKKYSVDYLINVDGETFINMEVVSANNKSEAFVLAREKGEGRYLLEGYKCVISETIDHKDTLITDITDMNVEKELDDIFKEMDKLGI